MHADGAVSRLGSLWHFHRRLSRVKLRACLPALSMRVLVTGAAGFVGSHVVAAYQEAGFQMRACVRSSDKIAARRAPDSTLRSVEWIVVPDLARPEGLLADAVKDVDTIVHVAAPAVRRITDGRAAVDNIVGATREILKAAKSSSSVRQVILTRCVGRVGVCGD